MTALTQDITDFMASVTKANLEDGRADGLPAKVFKAVRLDDKVGMVTVCSGYRIQSASDGRGETNAYFFKPEEFIPVVQQLQRDGSADIALDGIHLHETDQWDHSYDRDDSGYASAQKGHVQGKLSIKDNKFVDYSLQFTPKGEKHKLSSDVDAVEQERINSLLLSLAGESR